MGVRKSFGPKFAWFVSEQCVPVAIPGGNGFTLQTATGKVLGAPKPGWSSDMTKGMKEFADLPESERKPKEVASSHVYRLPPPPGGLVLRVYTRGFEPGPKLVPIARHSKDYSGPQRNFLWLTEAEWKSLSAHDIKSPKVKVPDAIARRLFRHHLIDNTIGLAGSWGDKDIRAGELWVRVAVARTQYFLQLEGSARLANDADFTKATHKGQFRLSGRATYDINARKFTKFELVALGEYENAHVREYYEHVGQRKSLTLGVAFELAEPGSFGYGSVPFALWSGIKSCKPDSPQVERYFGSNPYRDVKKP